MLGLSIRDSAPSAKAGHLSDGRARGVAIAQLLLALICTVMFLCALAAPIFVPLLIG
jgi:hypothetical protein